jgi:hypothetical protein
MSALIKSNLHQDATQLTDDEFAVAYNQAIWLEGWRLRNQAELLASMFGAKKKGKR